VLTALEEHMLEKLRTALNDITQEYRDTRVHHCQMQVAGLETDQCMLSGTVLDGATQTAVTRALAFHFPEIAFDLRDVQVLRPGKPLTVGTNISSLHAEPSFRSEMVSQLLNGCSVELLLERDRWAYVRQADGYLGWTYGPYLTAAPAPDPTHIVCEPVSLLYEAPDSNAPLVSRVVSGTAVHVTAEEATWACLSLAGDLEGWGPATDLRRLDRLPRDEASRRKQIIQDAARLTGVPYLWGGCTALAIDCSGMAQLLHRLAGLQVPRDADMQYDAGQSVEPPFQPGDLLFFGDEGESRSITHVGVSLGGWRVVHSSRARNGVYEDDVQAVEHLWKRFVGARTFVAARDREVR
jgi:hypothetical protein